MMSLVCTSLAVVVALQAVPVPKPDFSGTWTMDRSRSQSPASVNLDIKQTATEVSIETVRSGTTSKRTYAMEATPHPANEAITAGHSHAYWRGTDLVTEASGEIQGQTVSFKQTHSMNAAGTEMTVESLTIVQHGYSLAGGQNYSATKDVYVRAKSRQAYRLGRPVAPACVIVMSVPVIVRIAYRAFPAFAAIVNFTMPSPTPELPLVIVRYDVLLVAAQVQVDAALTLICAEPPAAGKLVVVSPVMMKH